MRGFIQTLTDEIEAIKQGSGGSTWTVFNGRFIRRDGPLFVYLFSTESALALIDDLPTEVEIDGQRVEGQVVSVRGTEIAVGIERDFGPIIEQVHLTADLPYLLQALKDRYQDILSGHRAIRTSLSQKLFGTISATTGIYQGPLDLPAVPSHLNDDQREAIRKALGSEVSFIWGLPGTGKTKTVSFLAAALLSRNLRVLIVSQTNLAADQALHSVAELLNSSPLYQEGKLLRLGAIAKEDLSHLFPMVTMGGIAETLRHHLKTRLAQLNSQLLQVRSELAPLPEAVTLLSRAKEADREMAATLADFERAKQDVAVAQTRQERAADRVQACQERLARAHSAGRLKRLFLGLNPAHIQTELGLLESQRAIEENTVAAAKERQSQIASALDHLTGVAELLVEQATAKLTELGLTADQVNARTLSLSRQSEQMTAEIRALEQELESIRDKILREARLMATTLTQATISQELEDQQFDALILDEANLAPMPGVYYAATKASQKVIIVGDFRQLPPISVAASGSSQQLGRVCQTAPGWLARDIVDQLEERLQQAAEAKARGQVERAVSLLNRAARDYPNSLEVQTALGHAFAAQDRYVEAVHAFLNAAALHRPSRSRKTIHLLRGVGVEIAQRMERSLSQGIKVEDLALWLVLLGWIGLEITGETRTSGEQRFKAINSHDAGAEQMARAMQTFDSLMAASPGPR